VTAYSVAGRAYRLSSPSIVANSASHSDDFRKPVRDARLKIVFVPPIQVLLHGALSSFELVNGLLPAAFSVGLTAAQTVRDLIRDLLGNLDLSNDAPEQRGKALLADVRIRNRVEANVSIEAWRRHYNDVRPHSSLG
jgi:transposase InsO family protein